MCAEPERSANASYSHLAAAVAEVLLRTQNLESKSAPRKHVALPVEPWKPVAAPTPLPAAPEQNTADLWDAACLPHLQPNDLKMIKLRELNICTSQVEYKWVPLKPPRKLMMRVALIYLKVKLGQMNSARATQSWNSNPPPKLLGSSTARHLSRVKIQIAQNGSIRAGKFYKKNWASAKYLRLSIASQLVNYSMTIRRCKHVSPSVKSIMKERLSWFTIEVKVALIGAV